MGRDDECWLAVFYSAQRACAPRTDRLVIESAFWLIDQQQRWTSDESTRDGEAPLLSVRQRRGVTISERQEAERIRDRLQIFAARTSEHQIAPDRPGKNIRH